METLSHPSTTFPSDEWEWVIECPFDPPHEHRYPSDWTFGGANGTDPASDKRWHPDTYLYFSDRAELLHITQAVRCDDQAIDYFTQVAGWGAGFNPVYIWVKRHGERDASPLPVRYNKETDEVYDT